MTQIVVTLDETQPLQNVRRAINMLKGVLSTSIIKKQDTDNTAAQKAYVKQTLGNALHEVDTAEKEGKELQSLDCFINELKSEAFMTREIYPMCLTNI